MEAQHSHKIAALQEEISSLLQQNGEIPQLRSKFDALLDAHAQSKAQRQSYAAELKEKLREKSREAHEAVKQSKQCMLDSNLVLKAVQRQYTLQREAYENALAQKGEEILRLQVTNAKLERRCAEREFAMTELFETIAYLEQDHARLEETVSTLQEDLSTSIQFATQDRQLNAQLRSTLATDISTLLIESSCERRDFRAAHKFHFLEMEITNHYLKLSSLIDLNSLEAASDDAKSYLGMLTAARKDVTTLTNERDVLKSDLQRTTQDHFRAKDSLEIAHKEIGQLEGKVKEEKEARAEDLKLMQEEVDRLAEDLEALTDKYKDSETQRNKVVGLLTQSRAAETQLQEEVTKLEEQLVNQQTLEQAHAQMSIKVAELAARNNLAEEDAAKLSELNASLIGHHNPQQRILQVQKIRSELAEVKKKHLIALAALDALKMENAELNEELNSLKAIEEQPHSIAPTMKKSVRRASVLMDTTNTTGSLYGSLNQNQKQAAGKTSIGRRSFVSVSTLKRMAAGS